MMEKGVGSADARTKLMLAASDDLARHVKSSS
jgi:hypothetical protein